MIYNVRYVRNFSLFQEIDTFRTLGIIATQRLIFLIFFIQILCFFFSFAYKNYYKQIVSPVVMDQRDTIVD